MEEHRDTTRRSFTQQAAAFESDRFIGKLLTEADWVLGDLELGGTEFALDVAAGTGHAARGLAPHVRTVIALDATPAMLTAGHQAAEAEGHANVAFMEGDALALPFMDGSFDVVVCRFAAHHFTEPRRLLGEMFRCVRPGGQVLLADLVTSTDPEIAARHNALERLRDPSHAACLSADTIATLITDAGGTSITVSTRETVRPLEPWLEQTAAPAKAADEIRAALTAEPGGGPVTGLHPQRRGDEFWFEQRFAAVTARA